MGAIVQKLIVRGTLGIALVGILGPALSSAQMALDRPPGTLVWSDGARGHLLCRGQGQPSVVLDAGLGGTSLDWSRVHPPVARFTRVCSYDRAGYGWSDGRRRARTGDALALELQRLLGHGGVAAPWVLVGHSFGGLVVRRFTQRFPHQVAGLVLVDASHEHQFARLEQAVPLAPRPRDRFVIANQWRVPAALPAALKTLAQELALRPAAVAALYGELRYFHTTAREVLTGGPLPPLPVAVLAHDSLGHARTPKAQRLAAGWLALQRQLASSHRTPLEVVDSGHYIHLERPERVVAAIRRVVEHHRRETGP